MASTDRQYVGQASANDFSYGGSTGAFANWAQGFRNAARGFQDRGGYRWDDKQYSQSSAQSDMARQQQEQGLGMLREQMDMSRGSAASDAVRYGAGRAAEMQRSLSGLATGGQAAQIAAASQAQQGNLLAGQQAAQQAQMVRSREAQEAALQYGSAASAMRGLDMNRQEADQRLAAAQAASRAQNAEQNAEMERFYEGLRSGALSAQQGAMSGRAQDQLAASTGDWQTRNNQAQAEGQRQAATWSAVGSFASDAGKAGYDIYKGLSSEEAARQQAEKKNQRENDPYGKKYW